MTTLIIGNGFDIDHDLPTRYKDFLDFVKEINRNILRKEAEIKSQYLADTKLKTYVKELFLLQEKRSLKKEVITLLKGNMWIEYFLIIEGEFGENWIDFESEISQVVQELERVKDYVLSEMKNGMNNIRVPEYMKRKLNKLKFDAVSIYMKDSQKEIEEYISKWVDDLESMIRLLEIYLSDYVQNLEIEFFSPDIFELNPDHVISFNYTDTFQKMYSHGKNSIKYNYIHGKAVLEHNGNTCNMVLGIDEYLDENRKNKKTEFIQFKKYYQRIHKKTDCEYAHWFDKTGTFIPNNSVYVFGHSLDITDGDILTSIFSCPNTYIYIYYYDEGVYGKQIANLVSLLGQEVLLSKVYGEKPNIIFKKQKNRKHILNSEFEIATDISQLENLYNYNNIQAQKIVSDVARKVQDSNISYFGSQENVVSMYNVLRIIGLAEDNRSRLLSVAKTIYDNNLYGKNKILDASLWDYDDYAGHHNCPKKTAGFIGEINDYNKQKYKLYGIQMKDEKEGEESYLLHPDNLEESYSIEDYEKTFEYALDKMDLTTTDTREVLNALVTIGMHLDHGEVKNFYIKKYKSIKRPEIQAKILYILECIMERLYEEELERQFEESMQEYSL